MANRLLKWFDRSHAVKSVDDIHVACRGLAKQMDAALPEGPEKTVGMRKLLEAKDCFVRAKVEQENEQ